MPGFYEMCRLVESQGEVTRDTKTRIRLKLTTEGMPVNRGVRANKSGRPYASDPGDFGRGIYYDTSFHRAKTYGDVTKTILKLRNPLVLTSKEAYALAERFQTVKLGDEEINRLAKEARAAGQSPSDLIAKRLLANAQAMTDWMVSQGYDGLVSIGNMGSLEIVDYRPYQHGG